MEVKKIKNLEIKNKIKKLNKSSQEVLEILLSDAIIEMNCRERIGEDVLKRIVLVYLSLFDEINYKEYDELKLSEKNIICKIISKGIASIYVDDEYITDDNAREKLIIIDDLISLLCFLTSYSKTIVKRLVIRDIKVYFYNGWRWDFL